MSIHSSKLRPAQLRSLGNATSDPRVLATADRIAAWAVRATADDLPQSVKKAATRSLVDVVGCALAGASHPTTLRVLQYAQNTHSGGACSTVCGSPLGALGAALVNGTAAHVWDFDDTSYEGVLHPSTVVWPAALAASELIGGDGARLLVAYVCGVEAEAALGRAFGDRLFGAGFWTTAVLGSIAGAVAAGRAIGLDQVALSQAIRLAGCRAGGLRAVLGAPAKPVGCGLAAQAGLEAALLAASGLEGPEGVVEGKHGLASVMNAGWFDPSALDALGRGWSQLTPGFSFKLFPACSGVQAAVEATIDLVREYRIEAGDVAQVRCAVTRLVAASLVYDDPATPEQAQFSMPYAIACALLSGNFSIADLTLAEIGNRKKRALMDKVIMITDPRLAESEADRRDRPEAAIVEIQCFDGRRVRRSQSAATGMPSNPMSDAKLEAKFARNAALLMAPGDIDVLLARIQGIEGVASAGDLLRPVGEARSIPLHSAFAQ